MDRLELNGTLREKQKSCTPTRLAYSPESTRGRKTVGCACRAMREGTMSAYLGLADFEENVHTLVILEKAMESNDRLV